MKIIFLTFLVLICAFTSFGQPNPLPCNLTFNESPVILRIKLGMSTSEAGASLGVLIEAASIPTVLYLKKEGNAYQEINSLDRKDYEANKKQIDLGEKIFDYRAVNGKKIQALDGIQRLILRFYNDKIYSIHIEYEKAGYLWKDAGEFAVAASEKLNLPKESWSVTKNSAILSCKGFAVWAFAWEGQARLDLADGFTHKEMTDKAKKILDNDALN